MQVLITTILVMAAFASNSLLTRAALAESLIEPGTFALLRVASGSIMLLAMLRLRSGRFGAMRLPNWSAIGGLSLYLLGFSFAYVSMDAGLGALILFGGVQITMFSGALWEGERVALNRWIGAAISFAGLCLLLWPSERAPLDPAAALLMAAASVGWGWYSLIGRGAVDPLGDTAWNFIYATPIILFAWLAFEPLSAPTLGGVALALVSGAVTSGLGYAAWFALLPRLGASRAALAQLSVPALALALGAALLGETISLAMTLASILVVGGVLFGMLRRDSDA